MTFEQLDKQQQESIQEANVSECEAMHTSGLYSPLIEHYEAVEKRNRAIVEGNLQSYNELTEELFDENLGDC